MASACSSTYSIPFRTSAPYNFKPHSPPDSPLPHFILHLQPFTITTAMPLSFLIITICLLLLVSLGRSADTPSCPSHAPPDTIPPDFTSGVLPTSRTPIYYLRRTANTTGPTLLFLHGWPQNWASYHRTIPLFPPTYDLILINLPGVQPSAKPRSFTKASMARDVAAFLNALNLRSVHIVSHDIGGMVAYAFAAQFPARVHSFTIMDVPLPGTTAFQLISADPRAWHFGFNGAELFPEALTTGREPFFYAQFMREIQGAPDALTPSEIRVAVDAYSVPSTAEAGFEWYRAFERDAKDNERFASKGKLKMPVLALNGGRISTVPYVLQMMQELAVDVRGGAVDSGHWIPEESAEDVVGRIVQLVSEVEAGTAR